MRPSLRRCCVVLGLVAGCAPPARMRAEVGVGVDATQDGADALGTDAPTPDVAPDVLDVLDAAESAAGEAGPDGADALVTDAAPDGPLPDAPLVDSADAPDAPDAPDVFDAPPPMDAVDEGSPADAPADAPPSDAGPIDEGIPCLSDGDGGCMAVPAAVRLTPQPGLTTATKRPVLRWRVPAGAVASLVRICTDPNCATTVPETRRARVPTPSIESGGVSTFDAPELDPGVYFWTVRALFATPSGEETWASELSSQPWPFVVRANRPNTTSMRAFCPRGFFTPRAASPQGLVASVGSSTAVVHRFVPPSVGAVFPLYTPMTLPDVPGASVGPRPAIAVGDVDCDGVVDVVLGAPAHDGGRGAVFVRYGASGRTEMVATGSEAGARLGASVAAGGDLQGDGCGDAVAGAPNVAGMRGEIVVLRGSPAGPRPEAPLRAPAVPELPWTGQENTVFGSSVALFGDVDADGCEDLVIGAPTVMPEGGGEADMGRGGVIFWPGHADGLAASAARVHGVTLDVIPARSHLGGALRAVGDVDGDGNPDAFAGMPGALSSMILFGSPSAPYIAYRPDTIGTYYGLTGSGPYNAGDVVGGCFDVNNDGRDDVAMSVRATDATAMVPSGVTVAGFVRASSGVVAFRVMGAYGGMGFTGFGTAIGAAGDIDGDSIDDMLFNNVTNPTDARIFLYRGAPGAMLTPGNFVTLQSVAPVPPGFGSGLGP